MKIKEVAHSVRGIWLVVCFAMSSLGASQAQGQSCALYPLAVFHASLSNAVAGVSVVDVLNGTGAGQFGWLSWGGSPSEPTLVVP